MKKEQLALDLDIKRKTTFTLEDVNIESNINVDITFIDKQKDLKIALNWLKFAPKLVGVDIETRGLDPHQHEMIMFQFGDEHRQFVIDTRIVDITEVIDYLLVDNITIVGQNLKFEYKFIKHKFQKELINLSDTLILEKCLYNGRYNSNSLKALAKRYLNYEADKTIRMRFLEIGDDSFSRDEIVYGALDVVLPLLISKKQREKVIKHSKQKLVAIEHNMIKVLGDMEYKGLYVDKQKWLDLYKSNIPIYESKLEKLNNFVINNKFNKYISNQCDLFDSSLKCTIKWSSSKQVISLFKVLGICPKEVSKSTKKLAYTVDARVLKASLKSSNIGIKLAYKELIKLYLDMKKYEQRVNTFGKKWLENINTTTGRVHSNFNQIITSGRMSNSGPNLQQIPSDGAYRECFTSPENTMLINADYSSQENILLVNHSQEPALLDFYKQGHTDFHSFMASKVFPEIKDLSYSEINKKHHDLRQKAKIVGFTLAYGGNGFTLSKNIGIPIEQGEAIYEEYMKSFPALAAYFKKKFDQTIKLGYVLVDELINRTVYLPYIGRYLTLVKQPFLTNALTKEKYKLKSKIERHSKNLPIQGSAAGVTKVAAIRFRNWIYKQGYQDRVFITLIVHDELLVETDSELQEEVATNLTKAMEEAGAFWCKTIPLKAEAMITPYWTH